MPADGLEAQDVVPPRPAFPAFLAGAGHPLLPSMIDYSVFSQLAAARGSIISGPVSRSAIAFNFCIQGQIRLRRHLVIGSQGRRPFSRKFVPGYEASTWFLLIRKQAN